MPDHHAMAFPAARQPTHTPSLRVQTQGRDWGCAPGRQLYARLSNAAGADRLAVHQTDGSDDEFAANLRLILAGGDVLDALKGILTYAEATLSYAPNQEQRRAAVAKAKAAIAKAEGRS